MLDHRATWLILPLALLGCDSATPAADGGVAPDGSTPCMPGEVKPGDDGCNACHCTNERKWGCTLVACPIDSGIEGGGPPGTSDASIEGGGPPGTSDASIEGGGPPATLDSAIEGGVGPGTSDASIEGGGPPPISDAGGDDGRPCGNFGSPFEGGVPPQVYEGGIICGTKPCGARAGSTCAANEYCAYRVGEQCGAADMPSTCQLRPPGCNFDYHPVCGCDQKNYGNACIAATAGTGVLKQGSCED